VLASSIQAVNPISALGMTKRMAESMVFCINEDSETNFISVRFGNIWESSGSVTRLFKNQIEKGGPLTVTQDNMERYFMTKLEAVNLLLNVGGLKNKEEIFIHAMGKPLKINELAKRMIDLIGNKFSDDIEIRYTGIRLGEKNFEEINYNYENTVPTSQSEIYGLLCPDINSKYVMSKIEYFLNYKEIEKAFNELYHSLLSEMVWLKK